MYILKRHSVKYICAFMFIILVCSFAFADYNVLKIPDSSEVRGDLLETWFFAPLEMVRHNKPEIRNNRIGEKFKIYHEETDDTFSILVCPCIQIEMEVYSDKGNFTTVQDMYPKDALGSWVLVRSKGTGAPLYIRCYFSNESDVFVQFSPYKNQGVADFLIYNCYAAKSFQTGIPFERFYTASFAEMQKWTQNILPWSYTEIYSGNYYPSLQMVEVIRENLDKVVFTEDAMYDGDNEPVYISSGKKRAVNEGLEDKVTVNGLGFLKWIGDGLIFPLTGTHLKRDPLIEETVSYKKTGLQGVVSEKNAIFMSLDWIRNLASAIVSIKNRRNFLYSELGVDVQVEPFTAQLTDVGVENTIGFTANSGYVVSTLKPLLYVLAVSEPDNFFFGAIRQTDRTRSPEITFFNDGVVLFPYFDAKNRFNCIIFKDGEEIPFDSFVEKYSNDFIFLVRVHSSNQFVLE